jgi:hypothetical protein
MHTWLVVKPNTDVIANFTQGQNRDHMRFVYLLSPGCDALWRRAGDLLLLGCLMHPPSSPLGCLHSRRRQNLCQLVGLSLRAFLSRGYRKPEARQGVAPLRQKVTGDALPWGAGVADQASRPVLPWLQVQPTSHPPSERFREATWSSEEGEALLGGPARG